MSIETIAEKMSNLVAAAEGRELTDDEATEYEGLETQLQAARRSESIRARQNAYETPIRDRLHVAPAKPDETYNQAFNAYLRTGKPNSDLERPTNALQVGTDTEGGFLVSPQFRQKLVEVRAAFGGFAAEADSFATERGGTIEYPSLDDTANSGSITAEEAAVASGADLVFGTVSLGAFKYTSAGAGSNLPLRVSVELIQDAEFDIEGLVARALQTRIMRKQSDDWVNGGGTTLPLGVFHDATTADVVLDSEATLVYLNLLEAEAALDQEYLQNAKWLMSSTTWVTVIKNMLDGADRPLVQPQAQSGIGSQPVRELLGYPVVLDSACNAITGDGATGPFLGLGDWREAYAIRRVAPFSLVVDPYTRAVNGQVQYHAWERADGTIQNRSAFVAVENITT